jgi:hypothetical protein
MIPIGYPLDTCQVYGKYNFKKNDAQILHSVKLIDKSFMEIQDFVSFAFRSLVFVKHLS